MRQRERPAASPPRARPVSGDPGHRGQPGSPASPSSESLRALLAARIDYRDPTTERFLPSLLAGREGVLAVVLYGSRLHPAADASRSPVGPSPSVPDFYLVVDSLFRYHRRIGPALLNAALPPSVYHHQISDGDGSDAQRCKVCVISAPQIERETSQAASDFHHLGRFSKRVGLVYARDAGARRLVLEAQARSLELLTPRALALLPERFDVDTFARVLLGLSYRAEPRVFEPDRAAALFHADPEHYRTVARCLLAARPEVKQRRDSDGTRACLQPIPSPEARAEALSRVSASRLRELLRWPKYLLTFDGWLDYSLAKLERHTGHRVQLSERQRRHPLLFGWPTFFSLTRAGLVR